MTKPKKRRWHAFVAAVRGTFWTTCPRCHHRFGGHEKFSHNVKFTAPDGSEKTFRIVCAGCAKHAAERDSGGK